jgi:hypothetical protein
MNKPKKSAPPPTDNLHRPKNRKPLGPYATGKEFIEDAPLYVDSKFLEDYMKVEAIKSCIAINREKPELTDKGILSDHQKTFNSGWLAAVGAIEKMLFLDSEGES